jgi:plastocyanin
MMFSTRSKPAIAAVAAIAAPLPLHMIGRHHHGLAAKPQPHTTASAPAPHTTTPGPASAPATQPAAARAAARRAVHRTFVIPLAHAAGAASDTISDFQFTPGTITVHVGDSITWTNNGPSPHTATASDGSFNTGTLRKGQSGSHTFTQAGTFAYICAIHPFMHGTVVVLASAASSSSGSSGSSGSGSSGSNGGSTNGGSTSQPSSSSTPTNTNNGNTLPVTGMDLLGTVIAGLGLLAAGIVLRRRTHVYGEQQQGLGLHAFGTAEAADEPNPGSSARGSAA